MNNKKENYILYSIYSDVILASNNVMCDFKSVETIFKLLPKIRDIPETPIDVVNSINFYTKIFNMLKDVKSTTDLKSVIKFFYIDHINSKLLMSEYALTQALSRICGHLVWRCIAALHDPRVLRNPNEFVEYSQKKLSEILLEINPDIFELLQEAEKNISDTSVSKS